jgi:prephenate dehydratase
MPTYAVRMDVTQTHEVDVDADSPEAAKVAAVAEMVSRGFDEFDVAVVSAENTTTGEVTE